MATKANILLVGCGGVGTLAAYNLESGGLANVTAVLRSNYQVVSDVGFEIRSIDHGHIKGYKPTTSKSLPTLHCRQLRRIVLNSMPKDGKGCAPYDYIVVTTKNIADVHPTVAELISSAVTPSHTTVVLLQNGLNIEKPIITAFPNNPVLSGVSLIGATETAPGSILHDDRDRLIIGPFENPNIPSSTGIRAAKRFVELYSASGRVTCTYDEDVGFARWRKLIYNACYNSACAITHMDTSRMRYYRFPIDEVVRPLMQEIFEIAKKKGHELPDTVIEDMIHADPEDTFFKPSMQQDIEKVRYTATPC